VERVALVGLPGSGKSAVGAALARRLGWNFADTDALVEQVAGRRIAEIFATVGEDGFRELELDALRRAVAMPTPAVIACGGGMLTREEPRNLVLENACVVWLDGDDELLLRRLGDGSARPLLAGDPGPRLAALRAARSAEYARAQVRVDVGDGDIEDVCDRIADALSGARLPVAGAPQLHVELGDRSYPVTVGSGVALSVAEHVPSTATRVAVVADRAVLAMARRLAASMRGAGRQVSLVALAGGEGVKTWYAAGRLVARFAALGLDRGDCAVVVGGGSVGDLGGFAAASYQRGIACIQVPTTLLAMVDSAIGGKTGVNLAAGKNLAGAFWQPRAVLCDLDALQTVPDRAYRAAFSEIVKYAMVADASLAGALELFLPGLLRREPAALTQVVLRCCAIKAEVVASDEREAGRRAILNYGHTVGHALEAVTGYSDALLHGEAVACGMRVAGRLSMGLCGCPEEDVAWQDAALARCGLQTAPRVDPAAVVAATRGDKKARSGAMRWVLVERRGEASFGHLVPEDEVLGAVAEALAR